MLLVYGIFTQVTQENMISQSILCEHRKQVSTLLGCAPKKLCKAGASTHGAQLKESAIRNTFSQETNAYLSRLDWSKTKASCTRVISSTDTVSTPPPEEMPRERVCSAAEETFVFSSNRSLGSEGRAGPSASCVIEVAPNHVYGLSPSGSSMSPVVHRNPFPGPLSTYFLGYSVNVGTVPFLLPSH